MKHCPECGGEIKPTINIFKRNEKEFEKFKKACKEEGISMPKSHNCIKCGRMWNEKWEPMKIRLAWLDV